jgi:hypothetical protein
MKPVECAHERDLIDAVVSGRWPERCTDELRAHAAACEICCDVAAVSAALQDDYSSAWQDARVPPSGLVWWRAETRARQEAMRLAARPIHVIEALAGACGLAIAAALLSRVDVRALSALILERALPLSLALGVVLVIAPIALYFVLSDE